MANNNVLFNAAFNGVGGSIQQRWVTSVIAANYVRYQTAMVAFATAVDAAIPAGNPSQQDADLLQSLCSGVLGNRDIVSFVSADYNAIAASIAVMYNQLKSSMLPSGSGLLSTGWWVDFGADVGGNGSAESPFKEVNTAVAAAVASGRSDITLLIVPGLYATDVAIDTSTTLLSLTLFGLASSENGGPAQVSLQNVNWTAGAGGVDRVIFRNLTISGNLTTTDVTGAKAYFYDSVVLGNIVNAGQVTNYEFNNTNQLGTLEGGNVVAKDCRPQGIGAAGMTLSPTVGTLELYNSFAGNISTALTVTVDGGGVGFGIGAVITGGGIERTIDFSNCGVSFNGVSLPGVENAIILRNCRPAVGYMIGTGMGDVTFTGAPGSINMDSASFGASVDGGVPTIVTNGRIHVPVGYADIIVAVPAVAAATLAYLDVSTVGTPLEGVSLDTPILVNPKGDIEPAGAGAGGLMQARVSAVSTVRLAFQGVLTGGNVIMRFSTP